MIKRQISEVYRVLKYGGLAILQVPISQILTKTYEDETIVTLKDRGKAFGQNDHVRIYAHDYKDRLEDVGFYVEIYDVAKEFGPVVQHKYGLN